MGGGGGGGLESLQVRGEYVKVVHPVTSCVEGVSNPRGSETSQKGTHNDKTLINVPQKVGAYLSWSVWC